MHSLSLLDFVYLAVFDVVKLLKNTKFAISEQLELQILFTPFKLWGGGGGQISKMSLRNFSSILQKPECRLCFKSRQNVLIEQTFDYFLICKSVNTTVNDNNRAQFTFLLVMRLNVIIVLSDDSLVVILVCFL